MDKRLLVLCALALILTLGATVSAQERPTVNIGAVRDVGGGDLPTAALRDSDFEGIYGSPPQSDAWRAGSTGFGSPLCSACISPNIGPHSGTGYVWFGGTFGAENAFIEQQVYIPDNTQMGLIYEYWIGTYSSAALPTLSVTVDGFGVDVLPMTGVTPGYASRYVNLDSFADGELHILRFTFSKISGGIVNLSIDDVQLYKGEPIYIENPGFEAGEFGWSVKSRTNDKAKCTVAYIGYRDACGFRFKGSAGENSQLKQVAPLPLRAAPAANVRAPDQASIYLGAFINANASAKGKLKLKVNLSNGSQVKANVALAGNGTYRWVQTPPKVYSYGLTITKVQIIITHKSTSGKILLDDFEIFEQGIYS